MEKMYLQYFAEETADTETEVSTEETKDKGTDNKEPKANTPTLEDLKNEIASLKLEKERYKKSMDKAMSEASESKKKLKSYLSEEELKEQERAEAYAKQQEELETLRKDKAISDATNSFLEVGYNKDTAEKLAVAQYEGDNATYFALLKEANDSIAKAKEDEFIKSRPEPAHGTGEKGEEKDPFLQGFESAI